MEMRLRVETSSFFDGSMSDWGSRKRGFSVPLSNSLAAELNLLAGNIKTTEP